METLDRRYSRLEPFRNSAGAPFERPLTVLEQDLHRLARRQAEGGNLRFALLRRGFSLEGPLDLAALTRALEALPMRHDVLRTAYVERDGRVVAQILPSVQGVVRVIDAEDEARADEIFAQEDAVGFDLAQAPLMRFVVLRLGPTRHRLYMLEHHIVSDGLSNDNLLHELTHLYTAFTLGRREPMPPQLQYSDVARWQASWLDDVARAEYDAFWRQRLARSTPSPIEARHPPLNAAAPARCAKGRYASVATLGARVAEFARRSGTTMPIVMLAALAATMYVARAGGMPIGFLSANRRYATIRTVGMFATMFPIRTRSDGACTFDELVAYVQRELQEALAYQDIVPPLADIDGAIRYRVVFNYDPFGAYCSLRLRDVEVQHLVGYEKTKALFDLWLNLSCDATGPVYLTPEYNADRFDAERMASYRARFEAMLARALEDGGIRLDELASSAAVASQR